MTDSRLTASFSRPSSDYQIPNTKLHSRIYRVNNYFSQQIIQGKRPSNDIDDQQFSQTPNGLFCSFKQSETNNHSQRQKTNANPLDYPYCTIGIIEMKFKGKIFYGTGCIVGLNLVLTCAHNCFHGVYGKVNQMIFYPTLVGIDKEECRVKNYFYPKQYEKQDSQQLDFAILQLERDVGTKYGTLGLDFTDKKEGEQISVIHISGHSIIIQATSTKDPTNKRLNGQKGRWIKYQTNKIDWNNILTSPGQGGSPLFFRSRGNFYVIGLHTSGKVGFNKGLLLDNRVREIASQWGGHIPEVLYLNKLKISDRKMEQIVKEKPSDLQHLSLWNNNLTATGVNLICNKFKDARTLNLSCNQIDNLPDIIVQLHKLKQLDLSMNKLEELPETIGQLSNLQTFKISNNLLTILPESIGQLQNLRYFYLYNNHLTQLPDSIAKLTELIIIRINNNKLICLPESIGQLTNLKYLYLYGNQLTELPVSLSKLNKLQKVDVQKNPLRLSLDMQAFIKKYK